MTDPLPRVRGRAPRIALLLNKEEATDSRVLKTAATLREAGADVRIVSAARPGHPAGYARTSDGIGVFRVSDLDLVRLLPWLAATVRRLRGRTAAAREAAPPSSPSRTAGAAAPQEPPAPPPPTPQAVLADAWMRLYQAMRLTWYWLGAVRHLAAWKPDAVHANDGNTLAPAMVLRAMGSRIVYDSHELWRHRNVRRDRALAPMVEALIEKLGVKASSGVVTVSPSIVTWLQRRYKLRTAPTLVRNIPHRRGPVPSPGSGRLRALAGLGADSLVIAYCGGITTGRGLEETVDALTELPARAHLVMLGPAAESYFAGLMERAESAGVAGRVHAVGTVPSAEVPAALADADVSVVFVRPICLSYRYSLPNKLFESIHAGLPVVAADLPDTAAIVRRYGIGEVFSPERPDQLAAAISRVSTDGDRYRSASRLAADELDWEHEAAALVELYRRVLEDAR